MAPRRRPALWRQAWPGVLLIGLGALGLVYVFAVELPFYRSLGPDDGSPFDPTIILIPVWPALIVLGIVVLAKLWRRRRAERAEQ
jgi:hypothetical protein